VLFEGAPLRELDAATLQDAFADAPRTRLDRAQLGGPEANLVALLAKTGLSPSKSQARQAVESGSVAVSGTVCKSIDKVVTADDLVAGQWVILRRGKKTYHVLEFA
jgi:tyrosyl-tRNA synthetase